MIKHAMAFLAACAVLLLSVADISAVTPNDEGVRGADDSVSIQNAVDVAAKRANTTAETGYGTGKFSFTDGFAPNGVHVYRLKSW